MRLLIVQDESLAGSALSSRPLEVSDIDMAHQVSPGTAALDTIHRVQPDVVLLDVQLPEMTGDELLRSLRHNEVLIIVTRAVRALQTEGLDLPKPVNADQFTLRSSRGRDHSRGSGRDAQPQTLRQPELYPNPSEAPTSSLQFIIGTRARRHYLLDPQKIAYIESYGNYVRIYVGSDKYLSRDTVKRLVGILRRANFVRIARPLLVNLRAVKHIHKLGRGTFAFTLTSGVCLESSGKYRADIVQALRLGHLSK
jgi:two-component system LytT family response regulator